MLEWTKSLYGKNMKISRVKKNDYLGININLSTMVDYLKGVISDFEEVEFLIGTEESPDTKNLYTVME